MERSSSRPRGRLESAVRRIEHRRRLGRRIGFRRRRPRARGAAARTCSDAGRADRRAHCASVAAVLHGGIVADFGTASRVERTEPSPAAPRLDRADAGQCMGARSGIASAHERRRFGPERRTRRSAAQRGPGERSTSVRADEPRPTEGAETAARCAGDDGYSQERRHCAQQNVEIWSRSKRSARRQGSQKSRQKSGSTGRAQGAREK